jgi:hypothetical protein
MKYSPIFANNHHIWMALALWPFLVVSLLGSDFAPGRTARILRVVAASSQTKNRVACTDAEVASELKLLGMEIDPLAKVAWTTNERDLMALVQDGHLVVCGKPAFLAKGASIALTQEGGRPTIYVSIGNVRASKMSLQGSFFKMAKVQQLTGRCELILSL